MTSCGYLRDSDPKPPLHVPVPRHVFRPRIDRPTTVDSRERNEPVHVVHPFASASLGLSVVFMTSSPDKCLAQELGTKAVADQYNAIVMMGVKSCVDSDFEVVRNLVWILI